MASKQPDESSFAPASLGFGQRTDFEETDASQNTFANNVDKHLGPILARIGRIFVSIGDERHKVEGCCGAMLRKDQKALVLKLDSLKSDGDAYLRQLDDIIQSFNSAQGDQMRWVEIDLVKLWDRQIRESAMARRTLSSEYERLMAAMRQHADEHFGGEAAKPRGGPRTTLQWVVKNFDVSYYAEYPLRDIKLELRTNLRE
ncbi:hypothetical protein TWF102_001876 [Orbilia oligospora]|uniref:Uncharacterized protein n=1 Tax=Orbilia oligospora TaxID=2813651 RepID=A0A7C8NBK0_ORBOL|nr:hypothetical protein TWF102_001876 [Orbilia oligospora]